MGISEWGRVSCNVIHTLLPVSPAQRRDVIHAVSKHVVSAIHSRNPIPSLLPCPLTPVLP